MTNLEKNKNENNIEPIDPEIVEKLIDIGYETKKWRMEKEKEKEKERGK